MTLTTAANFIGAWRLVSYTVTTDHEVVEPYGPSPRGRLIYEPSGRMAVQVYDPRLSPFASGDPRIFTDAEARATVIGAIAYFGAYTVHAAEGHVVHHIEAASLPNWVGGDQLRYFTLDGDRLTLRTPPIVLGGRETVSSLVWERLSA